MLARENSIKTLKAMWPFLSCHKNSIFLILLLMVISVTISLGAGGAINYFIDQSSKETDLIFSQLNKLFCLALGLIVLNGTVLYLREFKTAIVTANVTEAIRYRVFTNIVDQDVSFIDSQNTGDLQTRIIADTNEVGNFLTVQIPIILSNCLYFVGGLIGTFIIHPKLALILIAWLPLTFSPLLLLVRHLRRLGEQVQNSIGATGGFAGEIFRNIKIVKTYNKESEEKDRYSSLLAKTKTLSIQKTRLGSGLVVLTRSLGLTGFAIFIWYSVTNISKGNMTIGELVAFMYFALLILRAAASFSTIFSAVNVMIGTAQKLLEFLDLNIASSKTRPVPVENDTIEYRDVCFFYPNRPNVPVLTNSCFKIEAGTHVAIVGASGSGKSTALELLLRLHSPNKGGIYFGGMNLDDIDLQQWRQVIGYVPQKESLISGTVIDNIRYGYEDADEISVRQAAKMAGAHEFIQSLPSGYHTDLGEVGNRLSGGQKQRISLSRALIRQPKILLLDEANSALDKENDTNILNAIRDWSSTHGATVISVAHRLSNVIRADFVVVMNNGVVVNQGTPAHLAKNCQVYQNLFSNEDKNLNLGAVTINTVG